MSNICPPEIHRDMRALLNAHLILDGGATLRDVVSELDEHEARQLLIDAIMLLGGAGIMWTTPAGLETTINCQIHNLETEAEINE